jgi:glycosyltransferase involved in cell wall biosynthesis
MVKPRSREEIMNTSNLASIIINNYNYARFLREAVDSALNQTYRNTEVIVVDDGSTDDSREIIASYGDRIIPVLKENGGQTSAVNAGFSSSQGSVIFFLDADDALFSTGVERAVDLFKEDVAKAQWRLVLIDADSKDTGEVMIRDLSEDDPRDLVRTKCPFCYPTPPMSGNAWSRAFLESVFPLPEVGKEFKIVSKGAEGPDEYLSALAPLFGRVIGVPELQGYYRLHGTNGYSSLPFDERVKHDLLLFDRCLAAVHSYCGKLGIDIDAERWRQDSWEHRVYRAAQEITALIPANASFILVDEDLWDAGDFVAGRRRIPFLEREGKYWGRPSDDATAIGDLERLRQSRADFLVFAWPAFWWLDHYTEFNRHLNSEFRCVLQNNDVMMFDLRRPETVGA